MSGATVISQVGNGNTFTAYINGTNDDFYDIYCNSTDICKIACQSSFSCSTLRLYCSGSCFVSCDEDKGIECPFSGNYSEWITNSPTSFLSTQKATSLCTVHTSTTSISSIKDTTDKDDSDGTSSWDGTRSILSPTSIVAIVLLIVFVICFE